MMAFEAFANMDVAFADCTDRAVNDMHAHFVVGELLEGLTDSFNRALHVGLDDDLKLLHLAFLHLLEEVIQRVLCLGVEHLFLLLGKTLLNELTCQTLVGNGVERIAARPALR